MDHSEHLQPIQAKKQSLKTILNNYIASIDTAIATTDTTTAAVVSARAAVDADNTVNKPKGRTAGARKCSGKVERQEPKLPNSLCLDQG